MVGARWISPLVGAVLAVAVLALLTRGLHLDGLADTADGLGPLRDRERALQVMHRGDVGPFGVATLVLTLLLQVACAAALLSAEGGWLALWSAVLVARLAMVRTGLPGVAVAAGSSLGRAVAGTVPRAWWVAVVLLGAGLVAGGATARRRPVRGCRTAGGRRRGTSRGRGGAPPRHGPPRRDHRRRDGGHGRGRDDRTPADRRGALGLGTRVGSAASPLGPCRG